MMQKVQASGWLPPLKNAVAFEQGFIRSTGLNNLYFSGGNMLSLDYSQNESGAWTSTKFRILTEMWLK